MSTATVGQIFEGTPYLSRRPISDDLIEWKGVIARLLHSTIE